MEPHFLQDLRKYPNGNISLQLLQVPKPANGDSAAVASSSSHMASRQTPPSSTRGVGCGSKSLPEYNACRMKGVFMPNSPPYNASPNARCQSSSLVGDAGEQSASHPLISSSVDVVDGMQIVEMTPKLPERDFAGSTYIPVYVMLPLGVINMKCELVDPDGLLKQLRVLKSVNVDGVMVDCWWGLVEAHSPQEYNWNGYRRLFQMVHELSSNYREGRRNPECLSWGVDKERVLKGRTGLEVYFDYMRSFRVEFNDFFEDGVITTIEVGLGPCGELRFPSCPVKHGWRYPGIGEFQCYDQYLLKYLRKAAEARGHSFWARGPDNAGSYSSRPHETGFFCDGGDYDGYYGRFFLNWYSQVLVDHGDLVLYLAKLAFEGTHIVAKLSGIHWWYKTASHAAELTAGFYNPCNRDGYAAIMAMLKKHSASLNFTSAGLHMLDQQENITNTSSDPEAVVWQVTYAARDIGVEVVSENALPFLDRVGYNKILDNAKPLDDPDGRYLSSFIYNRLTPLLLERHNLEEFERFVKKMHGESVHDLQV